MASPLSVKVDVDSGYFGSQRFASCPARSTILLKHETSGVEHDPRSPDQTDPAKKNEQNEGYEGYEAHGVLSSHEHRNPQHRR
jgi:hypothetical protein